MTATSLPRARRLRAALRLAPLAATLAILTGLSCFGDPAGPDFKPTARFSFVPTFSSSAAMLVDFDRVRIVFTNPATGLLVYDTVVDFPSDADSIALNLAVPVAGVGMTEDLSFGLALINVTGDTVFRGGPHTVTVTAGSSTAPVVVPFRYVGVGANAAAVRISPVDTSVFFSDSVVLTAVALDSAAQPIPGTPVEWTSLDTTRAVIPVASVGRVLGRTQRGPARIRARLVTGQMDTSLVRVQPLPSALALLSGNGQTGTVATTLAQPLLVRVTGADGLGVVGVKVRFAAVSGGTVDTLVVTDTTGSAAAQRQLGTVAGPDTVRASVTGLTGSPVTFVTTALPGSARSLAVTREPGTTAAGSPIAPAVQVAARDTFGNTAVSFSDSVVVALATNPAGGTLSGTGRVAATGGVATFSDLSIDRAAAGYTLAFGSGTLAPDTSAAFDVAAGAAARIAFSTQPPDTVAAAAPFGAVVIARDAFGNTATSAAGSVTLTLATSPTGDTLGGVKQQPLTAGVATFSGLTLGLSGAGYTLGASMDTLSAVSTPIAVKAGTAAAVILVSGDAQTDTAGATLAQPLVVRVRDASGNAVAGDTVTFTPAAGTALPTVAVTDALGQAQTVWSLGTTAGAQTLAAARAGLPPATFTATASAGAAVALGFVAQPTNTSAGRPISPPVTVRVRDQHGNTVTTATDTIYLGLNIDMALYGTTAVGAVNGVATFSDLNVHGAYPAYRLVAGAIRALAGDSSAVFAVTAGTAASTGLVSGDGQTAAVSTALAAPLVVSVQDSFGNRVPGFTVSWAVTGGGGTIPATSVTDTLGLAQATWTLGALIGTQTAQASATGLVGSPVPFTATAAPAGATASWTGAASTDWHSATNWSSGAVPGVTDTVYIPASAPQQPRISAPAMVGGLMVQNGATLTIDTLQGLTVLGTADASFTSVGGPGVVYLAGAGTVRGGFRGLMIQGTYAIRDSLVTTGEVFILGAGANLSGNGGYARIGGDLALSSDATLTMAAGDSIEVLGSATFAGGSTTGRLTGGTLRVAGDFTQAAVTSPESFVATGDHRLVLTGTGRQQVAMQTSGTAGPSSIGDLIIATTTDTVDITLPTRIADRFEVPAGARVVASDTVRLGGTLDGLHLAAGAALVAPTVVHGGPTVIDPAARYQVRNTVFTMAAGPQDIPALTYDSVNTSGYDTITVTGTARFTGPTTLAGDLAVFGSGVAQLAGQHVAVQGRLMIGDSTDAGATRSGGQLRMDQPTDSLVVYGNAWFGGASTTAGYLAAGWLEVQGRFTQVARGATADNFVPSGSFTNVFSMPPSDFFQMVGLESPGPSRFNHVLVVSAGASFQPSGDFVAIGNVDIRSTASVNLGAPYSFQVGGSFTSAGYLTLGELRVGGALNAAWSFQQFGVQRTIFTGTSQTIPDTIPYRYLGVATTGTAAFTAGMTRSVDSLVVEGRLDVNGAKITTGYLETNTSTGVLVMDAAADSLAVTPGGAHFLGGPSVLTAGTLYLKGGKLQESGTGTAQAFAASAQHTTVVDSLVQLDFANPGPTASHVGHLTVNTMAGASLLTPAVASGKVDLAAYASLDGWRLLAEDTVTLGSNSTLSPAVLEIVRGFGPVAGWIMPPETLIVRGSDGIPDTATGRWSFRNLIMAGSDSLIHTGSGGSANIGGSVFINGGTYWRDGQYGGLTITDSIVVTGTGVLALSGGVAVTVNGNARFAGGSTAGHLTSGSLTLGGEFRQGGDPAAFAPSSGFRVTLAKASGVQTVQLLDPVNSYFSILDLARPAADTVRLLSHVLVTDSAILSGRTVLASTTKETLRTPGTGVLDVHSGAVLRPNQVRFGTLAVDSAFMGPVRIVPDTAVFLNGGSTMPGGTAAFGWKTAVVAGGGVTSPGTTFDGSLIISGGSYTVNAYAADSVAGFLRTEGSGVFNMPAGATGVSMAVRDSAVFAGGTSTPGSGNLRIYGSFVQRGVGSSFQAGPGHNTWLAGAKPTVTFATPGITSTDSRFGQLWVARAVSGVAQPVSVTLGSPFYAVMLSDTSAGAADTLKSPAGQVITLGSFSLTNTVLDSTKIVVPDGVQPVSGDGITFLRMNRSDYQLEITRGAGYSVLLNSVGFMPLAGGDTGGYFGAYGGGAVAAFALAFTNSSPAYASILGRYTRGANVSVSWNGQALP